MFNPESILYEDNHLIVVNKRSGELVQPDTTGDPALEDEIKAFIHVRDDKPGNVFLGVGAPHRPSGQRSRAFRQDRQGADAYERIGQKPRNP